MSEKPQKSDSADYSKTLFLPQTDFPMRAGLPQRETRDQRLARTIAEAGRGDCNKGQFLGGGMGLLSLPFWVAAEATGQCAK